MTELSNYVSDPVRLILEKNEVCKMCSVKCEVVLLF